MCVFISRFLNCPTDANSRKASHINVSNHYAWQLDGMMTTKRGSVWWLIVEQNTWTFVFASYFLLSQLQRFQYITQYHKGLPITTHPTYHSHGVTIVKGYLFKANKTIL